MDLSERVGWMLLGMAVGFILGYIVASLRDIKEEVEEIDDMVKHKLPPRDERGFMRIPLVADVLYFIVLLIVVWGSFSAQRAVNTAQEAQERIEHVTECNRVYLGALLNAVEPRTTASSAQAEANVALQEAWYAFVQFQLHIPPYPEADQRKKANEYALALKDFLLTSEQTEKKYQENPYPTNEELTGCIQHKETQDE